MPPRARVSRARLPTTDPDEAPPPPARPAVAATRKKAAPRSRALSVATLEQLGARTLAELLMSAAQIDPALARSLRLALAGTDSATRLSAEVEKRLRTLARSKRFIAWDKVRPLARELGGLRETIAGPLAASSLRAAVTQMRLLFDLGAGVLERSDDGGGARWARYSVTLAPSWAGCGAWSRSETQWRWPPRWWPCWMPTATA